MALPSISAMQTSMPTAMPEISQNMPSGFHKTASAAPPAAPNTLPAWFQAWFALVWEVKRFGPTSPRVTAAIAGARKAQATPIEIWAV